MGGQLRSRQGWCGTVPDIPARRSQPAGRAEAAGHKDPRDAPRAKAAQYTPGWDVRYLSALVKTSDLTSRGMSKPKWRPDVDPTTFVLSMNVHRRHLTSAQKRDAIAAFIKADPTTSDRTVAKDLGVSDKTAGKVRADLEARAEIPHVSTRTDSAGRKQPATKRKPTPKPKATPKPEPIHEDTIAEQPITTEPPTAGVSGGAFASALLMASINDSSAMRARAATNSGSPGRRDLTSAP